MFAFSNSLCHTLTLTRSLSEHSSNMAGNIKQNVHAWVRIELGLSFGIVRMNFRLAWPICIIIACYLGIV